VGVNNIVVSRAVSAWTVPIAVANSVKPRRNLNKYSHNNTGGNNMKELMKNKKVWIGAAVVVIIFAWMLWSGQPAPVEAQ
jgi:hypothetical protein|tara:strand:- start:103 stop:342 length:240 start_codon:yes stop_codon:yes gene_type:complete